MESGETYKAELAGQHVTVKPYQFEQGQRFIVDIQPLGVNTVFGYSAERDMVVAQKEELLPADVEQAISNWIESQDL